MMLKYRVFENPFRNLLLISIVADFLYIAFCILFNVVHFWIVVLYILLLINLIFKFRDKKSIPLLLILLPVGLYFTYIFICFYLGVPHSGILQIVGTVFVIALAFLLLMLNCSAIYLSGKFIIPNTASVLLSRLNVLGCVVLFSGLVRLILSAYFPEFQMTLLIDNLLIILTGLGMIFKISYLDENQSLQNRIKKAPFDRELLEYYDKKISILFEDPKFFANANLTKSSLSIESGIPANHLDYYFEYYLEAGFLLFIAQHRIDFAKEIMKKEGKHRTVKYIAEACGYRSVNTFKKYFVQLEGMSPREYMRENKYDL